MLHHVEPSGGNLERSVSFWSPLMALLGYEEERWSYGMSYVRAPGASHICLLEAEPRHAAAGHHRKRVALNHLAFRAASIEQVDEVVTWLRQNGHNVLYEDRHPYAGIHCTKHTWTTALNAVRVDLHGGPVEAEEVEDASSDVG